MQIPHLLIQNVKASHSFYFWSHNYCFRNEHHLVHAFSLLLISSFQRNIRKMLPHKPSKSKFIIHIISLPPFPSHQKGIRKGGITPREASLETQMYKFLSQEVCEISHFLLLCRTCLPTAILANLHGKFKTLLINLHTRVQAFSSRPSRAAQVSVHICSGVCM